MKTININNELECKYDENYIYFGINSYGIKQVFRLRNIANKTFYEQPIESVDNYIKFYLSGIGFIFK